MPQQERGIRILSIHSRRHFVLTETGRLHLAQPMRVSHRPLRGSHGKKNKRGSLTLLLPLDPLPPGVVSGRTQRGVNLPTEAPRSPDGKPLYGGAEMLSSFFSPEKRGGFNPDVSVSQHFAADVRQCVGGVALLRNRSTIDLPYGEQYTRTCLSPFGRKK